MNCKRFNLETDIYFTKKYVELYCANDEEVFFFEYRSCQNSFFNISIKKPIKNIGKFRPDTTYYDLETAYGYGGFLIDGDENFLKKALKKYSLKCEEENIIAEFIRFHPFNHFPLRHGNCLDFINKDRDTVLIDLSKPYKTITRGYDPALRRNIRKARKAGLQYIHPEITPDIIKKFHELYTATMRKKGADDFYFFDISYFKNLLRLKNTQLHAIQYGKKIINMIITLATNNFIYYHLGATDPDYYTLQSNSFVFDEIIQKESRKPKIFYLGGGTDARPDNSLLRFKRKFSSTLIPYYIGGKIYNQKIYKKYNQLWFDQANTESKYFLQYRVRIP